MSNQLQTTPKSFWQKPEGKTGAIFGVGALLGGGWLLYQALPTLITLMQNTLYAGVLLVGLGAFAYVLLDPKFRTLVSYMYKGAMRTITKAFIDLDPISIVENYIRDMSKRREEMDKQIGNLKGQMNSLHKVIENNQQSMTNNFKLAEQAKKTGKQDLVVLQSRKAGRLEKSNMTLEALYKKMEYLYKVLTKMYESSGILLEDTKDEVEVKKRERNALKAGHSAFKSAMSIINGDPDKKDLFDQAMESMADDIGSKLGEMEHFMELSSNFISSIDLQQGVYEEDGLKLLENWEKNGTAMLLGGEDSKRLLMAHAEDDFNIKALTTESKENDYSHLLK